MRNAAAIWMAMTASAALGVEAGDVGHAHRFNRAPLAPKPYAAPPLGEVQADGWLRDGFSAGILEWKVR